MACNRSASPVLPVCSRPLLAPFFVTLVPVSVFVDMGVKPPDALDFLGSISQGEFRRRSDGWQSVLISSGDALWVAPGFWPVVLGSTTDTVYPGQMIVQPVCSPAVHDRLVADSHAWLRTSLDFWADEAANEASGSFSVVPGKVRDWFRNSVLGPTKPNPLSPLPLADN